MNVDKSTFPVQKLPLSKKTEEWKKASVDAIVAREGGDGFVSADARKEAMTIAYGLYNSEFDQDDFKYVTDPYKVEDGFPAKIQNFNIVRPKIDLLIGEESKRPFNIRVIQTNDDVVTELQEQKKALLMQYMMSVLGTGEVDENGEPITPEEIEKYMKYTYKSVAENIGYHALNYLKEKLNLANELLKGWKDGLIAGEEIYYVSSLNGEPVFERVNPLNCDYDKDPDLDFIEDGDWFVRRMEMSPSTIYDRYFDLMDESDLDQLLEYSEGRATIKSGADVNSTSVIYKEKISNKLFTDDPNLITVWHAVWRSYKKVGFLMTVDDNGEEIETLVDETYKVDEGETIEWEWIPEVWEGYRIGEAIYIGMGPVEYQHSSIDNPSNKKLPYCGVIYSNTNSESKSLVNIMKPLQYMYITLWYRLELTLARDKGKIINMDITQIPKSMGVDVNQWLHYLTAAGVNFINPYDEGWDVPGREGGKPAQFNQFGQVDLTMGNVIAEYVALMVKIEDMIGEISGVSKARQGQIHERSLVGNIEREVIQSSHITEPLFWLHNQAKRNGLTMLLDVAKHVWSETDSKTIHYILNDTERVFLDVEDSFLFADMDVFLTDSTKEERDIDLLKQLLQPAMQNGATLLDAAELLTNDNMSNIKRKLADIEEKRQQIMQQQAQAEQAAAQFEAELKQDELRIKEEDSIRKAQTDLRIALIKAEDEEESGQAVEQAKLDLQRLKQEQDYKLKEKQLAEDKRQAKTTEQLKREELQIKRKQVNKPNKTQ